MTAVDINDFTQEKQCEFEGERYCVRDNGAVLRFPPEGKRARLNDNQWTFGKDNSANPYLHIASVRVHRIVATAFHGKPPDATYVVDHIDSNCRNNRPGNLRWLTRLENALKNPATRKKIEYLCGSIEAFLENPSMLNDLRSEPNFKWMRTVTPEEARNCMTRMTLWANSESKPKTSVGAGTNCKTSFGERIYQPLKKWEVFGREPGLDMAMTPWCAQYMWRAPAYYPCCPQEFGADRLNDYFQNLKSGEVFSYSDHDEFCLKRTVVKAVILPAKSSMLVMCERADNKWSIIGIEYGEDTKHFIHFNLGSYSDRDEAEQALRAKEDLKDFWSEGYANQMDV